MLNKKILDWAQTGLNVTAALLQTRILDVENDDDCIAKQNKSGGVVVVAATAATAAAVIVLV